MHTRRLITFLLGAWMLGTGFMTYVAIHNLRAVDQFLAAPTAKSAEVLKVVGKDQARLLLRYQASRFNRDYFQQWEIVEIGLGLAIIFFMVFGTHSGWLPVGLTGMAVAIVVFLHFFISPEIRFIGDAMDFLSLPEGDPQVKRMWALHQVYSAATVVKVIVCAILTVYLLWLRTRKTTRKSRMSELDASDDVHFTRVRR